jgi:hypothetical protein
MKFGKDVEPIVNLSVIIILSFALMFAVLDAFVRADLFDVTERIGLASQYTNVGHKF